MAITNKLISDLNEVANPVGSDLIVANHLGTTSTIPLSSIMNYLKEQIISAGTYRTDIINSLSSEFIKRPTSNLGANRILAWDTTTATWVASSK
jgi:hypothetical protein